MCLWFLIILSFKFGDDICVALKGELKVLGYVMHDHPRESCIMSGRFSVEHGTSFPFAFLLAVPMVLHYNLQSSLVFSYKLLTA